MTTVALVIHAESVKKLADDRPNILPLFAAKNELSWKGLVMSRTTKVILGVIAFFLLFIASLIGLGMYGWNKHKDGFIASAKEMKKAGQEYGRNVDNKACIASVIARHQKSPSFGNSIKLNVFLSSCLDASKPTPGFCETVPAKTDFLKTAIWRAEQCQALKINDHYCPNYFGEVQEFCERDK